jgi:hypothetical protein
MSEPNFSKMSNQELRAYNIKSRRNHMKDMCSILNQQKDFLNTMLHHLNDLLNREQAEEIQSIYLKLISNCKQKIQDLDERIEEECREFSNGEIGIMINRNAPALQAQMSAMQAELEKKKASGGKRRLKTRKNRSVKTRR